MRSVTPREDKLFLLSARRGCGKWVLHNGTMPPLAYNRRAGFDFELLETYEAGLELLGTEVKSVRAGNISLKGAFITIKDKQAWLTNATIPPWQASNTPASYDPVRSRKLLLNASEVKYLLGKIREAGLTVVPVRAYAKGPNIKIEVALAKGKKQYNKKEKRKERDVKRDVDRLIRGKE